MPYGKLKCYHKSLWANYSSSIIQPSTLSYYMVNCYFNFFLTAKVPISAWICLTEVMSWILQKGVGDKALNQLEKSISSKLEAIVARQIHAQFQTSSKQALQVSSFWSTSTISLKALFAFSSFLFLIVLSMNFYLPLVSVLYHLLYLLLEIVYTWESWTTWHICSSLKNGRLMLSCQLYITDSIRVML